MGPIPRPRALIAAQVATALVRWRASGKAVPSRARLAGARAAPPIPCSTRAASSSAALAESPHSSEPRVKIAIPTWNSRLRPCRSASAPDDSSSTANASEYASITHCSWENDSCRPRWMDGSAVLTIATSSSVMNVPTQVTISVARW